MKIAHVDFIRLLGLNSIVFLGECSTYWKDSRNDKRVFFLFSNFFIERTYEKKLYYFEILKSSHTFFTIN